MVNKRKSRPVDSLSGIVPPKRLRPPRQNTQKNYLGIEPLPPEPKKEPKVIAFELKVPKLKLPHADYRRLARIAAVSIAGLVVVGAMVAGIHHLRKPSSPPTSKENAQSSTPTFKTLTPEVTTKKDDGVSYDPGKHIASFKDKITGVQVTVSQQVLPDTFKAQPEVEAEKLAKNFHATKVVYAGEVKAYSGVSSEDGTQTVIFTKKDLLVFIKATKELDKDGLVQYIINLK